MPAVAPLEAEQLVSATFAAPAASGFNGFLRSHEIQVRVRVRIQP